MAIYTLTYTHECVRDGFLYALVGRIRNEQGELVFEDKISYDTDLERLKETDQRLLPNMTGTRKMKSGQSWRTFMLP